MAEPEIPETVLVFTPDQVAVATGTNRQVLVLLEGLETSANLTPRVAVVVRMSAFEARQFAQSLINMADRAEEGLFPQNFEGVTA